MFVKAKWKDSCWREHSDLWAGRCDGPYVASEDHKGRGWVVWSSSGEAAIEPTEELARARMAELDHTMTVFGE